jgi:phage protein D
MQQVSYSISLDDNPLDTELLAAVREIEVEDHAELADMVRLKLALAVREDGAAWQVLDDDSFRRLSKLRIEVSLGSRRLPLIEAYVIETRSELSNTPGESLLEVVAMDPTSLMNLEERVRAWPDMADSDIASTIFGEYGFTPQVDQTQPTREELDRTVMQRGSDIQFLRELAERNGYECYVELNAESGEVEGHFHPSRSDDSSQGVLSVNLGNATNVNRFNARYDMLSPLTTEARNVDAGNVADNDTASDSQSDELGEQGTATQDRPRRVLLANTGLTDTGELQSYAQAVVDRAAWAIHAEGELSSVTYGDILRAKRPVNVRGAGRQFSGTYYVEKVLHHLSDEGYTQSFSLRRNATGVTGREDFTDNQALAS